MVTVLAFTSFDRIHLRPWLALSGVA